MTVQDVASLSEETPLLPPTPADKHAALYNRFSPARKRVILALVSCAGIVPRKLSHLWDRRSTRLTILLSRAVLVLGSFIPAIPQIVEDMRSSPPIIR